MESGEPWSCVSELVLTRDKGGALQRTTLAEEAQADG